MIMDYKAKYQEWLGFDEETKAELLAITDEKEIEDRFYKDLEFGTGGLRGVMGAGANRMNKYTVSKATKGLADYLIDEYKENISVAHLASLCNISTVHLSNTFVKVFAMSPIKYINNLNQRKCCYK